MTSRSVSVLACGLSSDFEAFPTGVWPISQTGASFPARTPAVSTLHSGHLGSFKALSRHNTHRHNALHAREDPSSGWAEPAQAEDEEESEEESVSHVVASVEHDTIVPCAHTGAHDVLS